MFGQVTAWIITGACHWVILFIPIYSHLNGKAPLPLLLIVLVTAISVLIFPFLGEWAVEDGWLKWLMILVGTASFLYPIVSRHSYVLFS